MGTSIVQALYLFSHLFICSLIYSVVQAVAVAMPAEAVEELAEAVQDANGGPIHIVTNAKSPSGGECFASRLACIQTC